LRTKKPPLEKKIVNQVKTIINQRGGFAVKIWGSPQQEKGIPDLLCCYRGRFIALEGKRAEDDEPSPYQQYQMKRITNAGGVALVIRTVEEAEDLLNRIDRETRQP
jgi:hypothetical protein